MSLIRVMIDMETTDTCENAGILTLGACTFGHLIFGTPRDCFYTRASLSSNEQLGRSIRMETMKWWDTKDPKMRNEAFGGTLSLPTLLDDFEAWAKKLGKLDEMELWSRGAGFDCNILQHAFLNIRGDYPFDFRNHMCQRTLERLMPMTLRALIPEQKSKHHALQDATFQANVIDVALRNIYWSGGQK